MNTDVSAAVVRFPLLTADALATARVRKTCRRDMSKKEEQLLSPEDHERLAAAALKSEELRGRCAVHLISAICISYTRGDSSYPTGCSHFKCRLQSARGDYCFLVSYAPLSRYDLGAIYRDALRLRWTRTLVTSANESR